MYVTVSKTIANSQHRSFDQRRNYHGICSQFCHILITVISATDEGEISFDVEPSSPNICLFEWFLYDRMRNRGELGRLYYCGRRIRGRRFPEIHWNELSNFLVHYQETKLPASTDAIQGRLDADGNIVVVEGLLRDDLTPV